MRMIPIGEIAESPTNPRRRFDDLDDLADSIGEQGVLEPLLVRPRMADGEQRPPGVFFPFELVAGHRRLRAARLAGLPVVPCVVREMDDAQALEAALVENGHREDVTPLDEASAFARLGALGRSAEDIAVRIGRSVGYVRSRLRLLDLTVEVRALLEAGRIHVGSALLLAQVTETRQRDLAKRLEAGLYRPRRKPEDPYTSGEVSQLLHDTSRRMSLAVWPLDDDELVPTAGACTICPRRTGSQRALLAEMEGEDQCLDAACWSGKGQAAVAAAQRRGELVLAGPLYERARETGAFLDLDLDVDDQDFEEVYETPDLVETVMRWHQALARIGATPSEWTLVVHNDDSVDRWVPASHLADLIEAQWPEAARMLRLRAQSWEDHEDRARDEPGSEPAATRSRSTSSSDEPDEEQDDEEARALADRERELAREKEAREQRARKLAAADLAAAIVSATSEERTTVDVWRAIVRVAIARADPADLQAIALRRELIGADRLRVLTEWATRTESTSDLRGLLFELTAAPAFRSHWLFEQHPGQTHGPYGIDHLLDAIGTTSGRALALAKKKLADEERAAEKAAKKAADKATKKKVTEAKKAREVRDGA